jgi:hypothetical protein
MPTFTRLLLAVSLLVVPASSLFAQTAADPSGHWTGAIHVPPFNGAGSREVAIEVDLTKNAAGAPAATFSQPAQSITGLPLANVAFDGTMVSFELKTGSGGGIFRGTLADAGSIAGEFTTNEGGYAVPFNLTRTGDAKVAAAPKSAPIGKELEGTWHATIEAEGKKERLVLTMANRPDGTAAGTIVDLDGSNVEIPVGLRQKDSSLTVEVAAVGALYVAELKGDAELVGTWKQESVALPVSFKRVAK